MDISFRDWHVGRMKSYVPAHRRGAARRPWAQVSLMAVVASVFIGVSVAAWLRPMPGRESLRVASGPVESCDTAPARDGQVNVRLRLRGVDADLVAKGPGAEMAGVCGATMAEPRKVAETGCRREPWLFHLVTFRAWPYGCRLYDLRIGGRAYLRYDVERDRMAEVRKAGIFAGIVAFAVTTLASGLFFALGRRT